MFPNVNISGEIIFGALVIVGLVVALFALTGSQPPPPGGDQSGFL